MRVMLTVEEIFDSSKNIKKIRILRKLCKKSKNIFLVGPCLERQKLSSKNSCNNYNFTKPLFEGFFYFFLKNFYK